MPHECEGLQGFPRDWTLPIHPSDDIEKLDTLRYTALGNAVTVPVAEWLASRIKAYLQSVLGAASLEPKVTLASLDPQVAF